MKHRLQNLMDGRTYIAELPARAPTAGQVLVRVRASAMPAGTERTLVDFVKRGLLGKARRRPDLVREDGAGAAEAGTSLRGNSVAVGLRAMAPPNQKTIVQELLKTTTVQVPKIAARLRVTHQAVRKDMAALQRLGLLEKRGSARATYYVLKERNEAA